MESKDIYESFTSFVCSLMFNHKDQIKSQDSLCEYLNKLNYSDFFKIFEILELSKKPCKHVQVISNIGDTFVRLIYNPDTLVFELRNIDCIKLVLDKNDNIDIDMLEDWINENSIIKKHKDKINLFKEYINKRKIKE